MGNDDENEDTRRRRHDHGNRGHGSHHHGDKRGHYHHGDRDYGSPQASSKVTFSILSKSKENIAKAKRMLDEVLENECSRTEIDISKCTDNQVRLNALKQICFTVQISFYDYLLSVCLSINFTFDLPQNHQV
jgi:ABC-type Zn2+ transport system substrate-binding protein/surface adhesin